MTNTRRTFSVDTGEVLKLSILKIALLNLWNQIFDFKILWLILSIIAILSHVPIFTRLFLIQFFQN